MRFQNSTSLDSQRLYELILRHTAPYSHDTLDVRIRNSRGADFSGRCYYDGNRIFVNLGPHNCYPYRLNVHIARSRCNRTHWWREALLLTLRDPYELVLFIYLHELYHHLVKAAGRCPRRKEAMCDRFATRALVDAHGSTVIDARGQPVPRERWDFQDLDRFVASAPKAPPLLTLRQHRAIPVVIRGIAQ